MACALLMGLASAEVIRESTGELIDAAHGALPTPLSLTLFDTVMMLVTVGVKLALLIWCRVVGQQTGNVTILALGQDAENDVLSNAVALVAAFASQLSPRLWLLDPLGAIFIGVWIIWNWWTTGQEQLEFIVGKSADAEFLELLREMAAGHDELARLDKISACGT